MQQVWTKERVEEVLRIAELADVASLDKPVLIDGEEATVLGDLLPSEEPGPEELAIKHLTGEKLIETMNRVLSSKERHILFERYGFNGRPKTLQEIADGMTPTLTRERIRQIEEKAIRKLKRKLKESDFRD